VTLAPVLRLEPDVAIVGSGFAGAMTAMALRRCGRSVVLLERGRHPRFAIGESSTPLANLLIEELADRYALPRLRPFSKWGTWKAAYPGVACGLKRGFTFLRHDPGEPFADTDAHERQLLVAASPHDGIGDTHWYRPDFDRWLAREAEAEGVTYLDETSLDGISFPGDGVALTGVRHGRSLHVHARFVVDASGPRGFLARALAIPESPTAWLPPTRGLYTHFTGVARWDALVDAGGTPPYPVDDAALHHVSPGGWMWVLRFDNGVTSAGVAVTEATATELRLDEGEPAWARVLAALPSVRAQFADARAVHPFIYAPRIAYRCPVAAGQRWAMLPSAAGVIDPLLSTGFPLTLLGIARLVDLLDRTWSSGDRAAALAAYARDTQDELDATERLVAALYASMPDFALFKRLGLLYFAAASYAEAVRRLGHPERARGFLLHADPQFGPALRACSLAALAIAAGPSAFMRRDLFDAIDRAIEPYDTAGLLDRSRADWYPVLAGDLLNGASKLGATVEEIDRLLARCGFSLDRGPGALAPG
jgi:tetracycline 7-halogenase / FADH2 O2-dependent halogenase